MRVAEVILFSHGRAPGQQVRGRELTGTVPADRVQDHVAWTFS